MTYSEKLKDPRWQKRRLEIMSRDDFTCRNCSDSTKTLNVDHKIYRKGLEPWEYSDEDLWTLCEDCHGDISRARQELYERIGQLNLYELQRVKQIIADIPLPGEVLLVFDVDNAVLTYHEFNWMVEPLIGHKFEKFGKIY